MVVVAAGASSMSSLCMLPRVISMGVGCAFVWASARCCIIRKNSAMQLLFRLSVAAACSPAAEQLTVHRLLLVNLGGYVVFL